MEPVVRFSQASFVKSAVKPHQYPESPLPEVAVVGRSNVGKSSLLNSLCQRKGLVQVSRTPGRTRLINFFNVNDQLMLVDLPGYGFAKVPTVMKREWQPMIESYLTGRPNLVACLLLLDIRRLPSEEDLNIWDWLRHFDMTVVPVLTKSDKLSKQQGRNQLLRIANVLGVPAEAMITSSAQQHKGREQLHRLIAGLCWEQSFPVPEEPESEADEATEEAMTTGESAEEADSSKTSRRAKKPKRRAPKPPKRRKKKKKKR